MKRTLVLVDLTDQGDTKQGECSVIVIDRLSQFLNCIEAEVTLYVNVHID